VIRYASVPGASTETELVLLLSEVGGLVELANELIE
jgi:hypothetical protein